MKMPGKCIGPKYLTEILGRRGKRHVGGHDLVRRVDRQGEVLIWYRNARVMRDRTWDELLQAGAGWHKRAWQDIETNSDSRGRQGFLPKRPQTERLRTKEENYSEGT